MASIEEERKKAFLVYASTYESALKYLTMEQMGELFVKLGKCSFEGKNVGSDNPLVDILLRDAKPVMKSAEERHLQAIENGKKGKEKGGGIGRRRKGETMEEYQKRVSEWRESRDSENPQKPLDKDIDIDTDIDTDKKKDINIERYRNKDVKKDLAIDNKIGFKNNTSIDTISVSTNQVSISNSLKPVLDNTKLRKEPSSQEKAQHHVSSFNSKIEGVNSKYQEDPRQGQLQGSKGSDFLRSITLPDDPDVAPLAPPSDQYRNYAESVQSYIRYDAEPNYAEMTDYEIMDAIKDAVDDAILCGWHEGKTQRYWDYLYKALKIYMHLNGCSEDDAKKGINHLYKQRENYLSNIDNEV